MSGIEKLRPLQIHRGEDTPSRRMQDQASDLENQQVRDVAKLYEKQFLREMVKAMRSTVSHGQWTQPSMAEGIYRDQLDQQYVEVWGDQGGTGLSELIYDQIMERYFGKNTRSTFQSTGPVELTNRDVSRVVRLNASDNKHLSRQEVPLRVELNSAVGSTEVGAATIKSPWDATIASQARVEGRTLLTLTHDFGLQSTMVYDGLLLGDLSPGTKVSRSQSIGLLNPDGNSFLWNLSGPLIENGLVK